MNNTIYSRKKSNRKRIQELPQRILVNRNDIQSICERHIKKSSFNDYRGIVLGGIISLTGNVVFSASDIKYKIPCALTSVLCLIGIIWIVVNNLKNKRKQDLLDEIYETVIENGDYTGIFIISQVRIDPTNKNRDVTVMTVPHGGEIFLPFIKNLENYEHDGKLDYKEVKEAFAQNIRINSTAIKIKPVDSFEEIKRTSMDSPEKMIRYAVFAVEINNILRQKIEETFTWRNISELLTDPRSVECNSLVISRVSTFLSKHQVNSFTEDITEQRPLKIIWNITNECGYNCQICASNTNVKELTNDNKSRALLSILSIGLDNIRQLNFSGGDPLLSNTNRDMIKYAQNVLGKDKVIVTTTGIGIESLISENGPIDLLHSCEITIDDSVVVASNPRGEPDYANKNYLTVGINANAIMFLQVDVPIIRPDMNESDIRSLVRKIHEIPVTNKQCNLMRLMPVGLLKDHYPDKYDPSHFIAVFKEEAKKVGLNVHMHCALPDRKCNMYEEKIGIDCAGNVFACTWAGYVVADINENPFYMGNVYEQNLRDILKSERSIRVRQRVCRETDHCKIFCYREKEDPIAECDPLIDKRE